jgi:hypothetical protein
MSHQKIVDALSGLLVADFVQYDWTLRSMAVDDCCGSVSVHFDVSSKVLITLTLLARRDNVLKPCQAPNHFKTGTAHFQFVA